jgi:archaellum component FlaG (FlaF/FlaG flagellin family)
LFSHTEGWKNFELLENVIAGKTRIKVTIAKVGSFQTKANTTRKKGEKTNCWSFLNPGDFSKKIAATEDIKKGDKLTVTLEIL